MNYHCIEGDKIGCLCHCIQGHILFTFGTLIHLTRQPPWRAATPLLIDYMLTSEIFFMAKRLSIPEEMSAKYTDYKESAE